MAHTQQQTGAGRDPFARFFNDVVSNPSGMVALTPIQKFLVGSGYMTFREKLKDAFTGKSNADPEDLLKLGSPSVDPSSTNSLEYEAIGEELISVHSSYLLAMLCTLHEEIIFFVHPSQYQDLLNDYEEVSVKVINVYGKVQTLQIKRYTGLKHPHWLGKAFMCGETQQKALRKCPDTAMDWMTKVYNPYYPVAKGKGFLSLMPPPEDPKCDGFLDQVRRTRMEAVSFAQGNGGPLYFFPQKQWSLSFLFACFCQREVQMLLLPSRYKPTADLLTPWDSHQTLTDLDRFMYIYGYTLWYKEKRSIPPLAARAKILLLEQWQDPIWIDLYKDEYQENLFELAYSRLMGARPAGGLTPLLIIPQLITHQSRAQFKYRDSVLDYSKYLSETRNPATRLDMPVDLQAIIPDLDYIRSPYYRPNLANPLRVNEYQNLFYQAHGRYRRDFPSELQMMEGNVPPMPAAPSAQDARVGINPPVEEMMGSNAIDSSAADLLPSAVSPELIAAGGVLIDLKELIYKRWFNMGEPLVFDFQKAHGDCIAAISYGWGCFNPYGKIYAAYHERFSGDFEMQIRMIGAAIFRGMIQVAVFPDKRASLTDYNILDGQRLQDHLIGANSTGSIAYRLKFTHDMKYFWRTEADLAGFQQTIALMVYINLINPFGNEASNVQIQILTRCAENFKFALPKLIATDHSSKVVVVPSDRLLPLVGKTIKEVVNEELGQDVSVYNQHGQFNELLLTTDGRMYPNPMIQNMDFLSPTTRIDYFSTSTTEGWQQLVSGFPLGESLTYVEAGNAGRPDDIKSPPKWYNRNSAAYSGIWQGNSGIGAIEETFYFDPDNVAPGTWDISKWTPNPFIIFMKDGTFPKASESYQVDALTPIFNHANSIAGAGIWTKDSYKEFEDPNHVSELLIQQFPNSHVSYAVLERSFYLTIRGVTTSSIALNNKSGQFEHTNMYGSAVHTEGFYTEESDWFTPSHLVYKVVSSAGTGFLYVTLFSEFGPFALADLGFEYWDAEVAGATETISGTLVWQGDGTLITSPTEPDRFISASSSIIWPTNVHMAYRDLPDLAGLWTVPSVTYAQYQNLPGSFISAGFTYDSPYPSIESPNPVGYEPTLMSLLVRAIRRRAPDIDGVVDLSLVNPDFGLVAVTLRLDLSTGAAFINTTLPSTELDRWSHAVYAADASKLYINLAAIKAKGQFLPLTDVNTWRPSSTTTTEDVLDALSPSEIAEFFERRVRPTLPRSKRIVAPHPAVLHAAIAGATVGGGLLSGIGQGLGNLGNMWYQEHMQQNYFNQQNYLQANAFIQQQDMAKLNAGLWLDNNKAFSEFSSDLAYQNRIRNFNLAGNLTPAAQHMLGRRAGGGTGRYINFGDIVGESSTDEERGFSNAHSGWVSKQQNYYNAYRTEQAARTAPTSEGAPAATTQNEIVSSPVSSSLPPVQSEAAGVEFGDTQSLNSVSSSGVEFSGENVKWSKNPIYEPPEVSPQTLN